MRKFLLVALWGLLCVIPAQATQTRYVNPASSAGGDCTTTATSGATRACNNLVDALNLISGTLTEPWIIEVDCDGVTCRDSSNTDQTVWDMTTTAANFITVRAAAGSRARVPHDPTRYTKTSTNINGMYNNTPSHIRFENIQVECTANSGSGHVCIKTSNANQTASDSDSRISGMVARCIETNGATIIGYNPRPTSTGNGISRTWNSVAYDCDQGFITDWANADFANNTAYNCVFGFVDGSSVMLVVNNLADNSGTTGFVGPFQTGSNFNATSDATAPPGANSRTSQTFSFHHASSRNLHLTNADGGARDFGTSDPLSGVFSDDIDGQTRSGSWDIGADETGAASAAITGTATASITEADVVTGSKTVIETLTNAEFLPATGTVLFVAATPASTTTAPGAAGNVALNFVFPTGYTALAGDRALAIAWLDVGTCGSLTSGWANIAGSPFGSGGLLYIFTRVLVSGDAAPSCTVSGAGATDSAVGDMIIMSQASIGAIGAATSSTGTPGTAAAITTTANNAYVLGICGRGDNENASAQTFGASATGVRERLDAGTNAGNDSQISSAMKFFATSGTSSGSYSSTLAATDPFICVQLETIPSTPFTDARSSIATNLDSAQSEAAGWDAKVKVNIPVANVVRTSQTVTTITLQAQSDYDITATETITATVPAAAVFHDAAITGSPTFTVTAAGAAAPPPRRPPIITRLLPRFDGRQVSGLRF